MRILQITYNLSSGGAERLVVDLSNELSKSNDIHLLTILDDKMEENNFYLDEVSNKVTYHNMGMKRGFSIRKLILLYSFIKSIKPDIVHFQGVNIILFFLPSIFFYRKPKYIETLHNKAEVIFTFKRFSFITKTIYRFNLVRLYAISPENKRSLERVCKINNVMFIYNGRALPAVSNLLNLANQEIEKLKSSPFDTVFIHVGRCAEQKNQKLLIRAFNELDKKGYNFTLLILGNGFETDLGLELKEKSCERIHYLGARKNVIDYLMLSDAFCLTSLYEGMPISLIEAIAVGCFPVCTPVSGVVDVISHNKTGLIAEDFSAMSYLKVLESFMTNSAVLDKELLVKIYSDYFSIESCASKYLAEYLKLITKSSVL